MSEALAAWRRAEPHLREALEHGGSLYDLPEVHARMRRGAQLWMTANSAAVTEIIDFPRGRAMQVWLAGGDLTEIVRAEADVEALARRQGCGLMLIAGRRGWERALKPLGYRPAWQVLRKDLSDVV